MVAAATQEGCASVKNVNGTVQYGQLCLVKHVIKSFVIKQIKSA